MLRLRFVLISGMLLGVIHGRTIPDFEVAYPKLLEPRGLRSYRVLHIKDGLTLQLEKTSVLSKNFILTDRSSGYSVDTMMNGTELERNLYHDIKKMAAVQVTEKNGTVEVRGILGPRLRILPLPLAAPSKDGRMAHKVFGVASSAQYENDYIVSPRFLRKTRASSARPTKTLKKTKIPDPLLVELQLVVDSHHSRSFTTEEELVLYMATMVSMVNIRYSNSKNPKVIFILIQISKDTTFQKYVYGTDPEDRHNPVKNYTSSRSTLKQLAKRYESALADIVVFVTGLKLANVVNNVISTGVKGFAHYNGLCRRKARFGQFEDVPHTFSGTSTLAHELGHLMGMPHDGEITSYDVLGIKWLRCSAKSGYLMAPQGGGTNEGFFTQCSLQHMEVFLKTVDQDCFKVKTRTVNQSPSKLPGGELSISTLCEKRYPHVSGITGVDEPTLRNNCEYLCCPMGDGQGSVTCLVESHVDGMPCGLGQICKRKRCRKHSVNLPPPPSVPINQP